MGPKVLQGKWFDPFSWKRRYDAINLITNFNLPVSVNFQVINFVVNLQVHCWESCWIFLKKKPSIPISMKIIVVSIMILVNFLGLLKKPQLTLFMKSRFAIILIRRIQTFLSENQSNVSHITTLTKGWKCHEKGYLQRLVILDLPKGRITVLTWKKIIFLWKHNIISITSSRGKYHTCWAGHGNNF